MLDAPVVNLELFPVLQLTFDPDVIVVAAPFDFVRRRLGKIPPITHA